MSHSTTRGFRQRAGYLAAGLAVGVALLCWSLWPRQVELSADAYEIAIALYRVCNQQDEGGLAQLQQKLDELNASGTPKDAARTRLQSIIDEAEAGDWNSAMRHTRVALENQTSEQ